MDTRIQRSVGLLIIDDHAKFRGQVRRIAERNPAFSPIREASQQREALTALAEQDVDIVTLDVSLQGENGLDVLQSIRSLYPNLPVLVLTMHGDKEYSRQAHLRGANGFLRKELVALELPRALDALMEGRGYDSEADPSFLPTAH